MSACINERQWTKLARHKLFVISILVRNQWFFLFSFSLFFQFVNVSLHKFCTAGLLSLGWILLLLHFFLFSVGKYWFLSDFVDELIIDSIMLFLDILLLKDIKRCPIRTTYSLELHLFFIEKLFVKPVLYLHFLKDYNKIINFFQSKPWHNKII